MLCVLGLGASEAGPWGDKCQTLQRAISELAAHPDVKLITVADIVESAALPYPGMPEPPQRYLNTAVLIETALTPKHLMRVCQGFESEAGRNRENQPHQWSSRPLDIDIILGDGWQSDTPELQVPHPRALERNFVMLPMAQIAPTWVIQGEAVANHVKKREYSPLPVYCAAEKISY